MPSISDIYRNYKNIADAIREMLGNEEGMTPNEMPSNIRSIHTGSDITVDEELDLHSSNPVRNSAIAAALENIADQLENLDGSIEVIPNNFWNLTEAQKDAVWNRVIEYIEPESGEINGTFIFHPFLASDHTANSNYLNLFFYFGSSWQNQACLHQYCLHFDGYEIALITSSTITRDDGPWEPGEEPATKYTIEDSRDDWTYSGITEIKENNERLRGYVPRLQPGEDFDPNPWTVEAYIRASLQDIDWNLIEIWAAEEEGGSTRFDQAGNSYKFVSNGEYPQDEGVTAYVTFWLANNKNTHQTLENGAPAFETYKVSISYAEDPETGDFITSIGNIVKIEPESSDVIANPTLAGTEAELTGLQIGNTKYKVGPEESSSQDIQRLFEQEYAIHFNNEQDPGEEAMIPDYEQVGPEFIYDWEEVTFELSTYYSYYYFPASITVTGASYTYDRDQNAKHATLTISQPVSNVYVEINMEQPA